ncbi:MAG: DUF255 domain-containing protein [Bacteroidetes bacterium]|nr:MAG: DUF255 domain-containing protein [Bacteroidota bacterium]
MKNLGVALFSFVFILSGIPLASGQSPDLQTAGEGEKIQWITWEELPAKMKEEPRKVVVDVYTKWCGWCKKMDATTFQKAYLARYLNENYYAIKFDAEYKDEITFKGNTYNFVQNGRRGYHQLAAEITNGRLSFPTLVFLDENLNLIQSIPGYKDPLIFEQIVTYFGKNMHKKQPWSAYQKNYTPMPRVIPAKN